MTDPKPVLVVLMGPPGSGKTTLARELAPALGAAWLNSDDLTDALFGTDRQSDAYVQARPALYQALYRIAETNLAIGRSVVVDAPHGAVLQSQTWYDELDARTSQVGAALNIVRCTISSEIQRRRMVARNEPRDAAKLAGWKAFQACEPDWSAVAFRHGVVDTSADVATAVAQALDYVRRHAKVAR